MLPKRSNNAVILHRCPPLRAQLSQEQCCLHMHQGFGYLHILVHIFRASGDALEPQGQI